MCENVRGGQDDFHSIILRISSVKPWCVTVREEVKAEEVLGQDETADSHSYYSLRAERADRSKQETASVKKHSGPSFWSFDATVSSETEENVETASEVWFTLSAQFCFAWDAVAERKVNHNCIYCSLHREAWRKVKQEKTSNQLTNVVK